MNYRYKRFEHWSWLPILLGLAMTVGMGWYAVRYNRVFANHSQDTGNMWQTIWNVGHGHGFQMTHPAFGDNVSRLSIHSDYLLILLAPLSWLTDNPDWLYYLQAAVAGLGTWYVWRIAGLLTNRRSIQIAATVAYAVYGPLHFALLWQFHAFTLSITFVLAMAEAILARRRAWVAWLWFGLAVITKENVGAIAGAIAWWLLWQQRRRALAWWMFGLGAVWTLGHLFLVIPLLRPDGSGHFVWDFYYQDLGSSDGERWQNLFKPWILKDLLFTYEHLISLIAMLVPWAGASLLSPMAYVGLAGLLPHWLSTNFYPNTVYHIAHVIALPGVILGGLEGLSRIIRRWPKLTRRIAVGLMAAGVVGSIAVSPLPWSVKFRPEFLTRDAQLDEFIKHRSVIPSEARVTVTRETGPYFRNHNSVAILPLNLETAEYLVIFEPIRYSGKPVPNRDVYRSFTKWALSTRAYTVVVETGSGVILRRDFAVPIEPIPPIFKLEWLDIV